MGMKLQLWSGGDYAFKCWKCGTMGRTAVYQQQGSALSYDLTPNPVGQNIPLACDIIFVFTIKIKANLVFVSEE